jgi:hypothetical protein
MKPSDFHIGLEFLGPAGFRWRCTDVGTRTVVAVQLDHDDPDWYRGPPYIVQEVVFDEHETGRCHLTEEDAIRDAVRESETSGHPGFPHEAVTQMMEARIGRDGARYPHRGVLRFDRRATDGEILHPYAAHRDGHEWVVKFYLPFRETFGEMPEGEFIALPVATAVDVQTRSDRRPDA